MKEEELKKLIEDYSLEHIAIIMDGNGRWAQKRGLKRNQGHKEGALRVIDIVERAHKLKIKTISLYAFSTENWKRPKEEVTALFTLLVDFIDKKLKRLTEANVRLQIMGDISILPMVSKMAVKKALKYTENNTGLVLNIGLNYGSRDEIRKGILDIIDDYDKGLINKDQINEDTLSDYLYTKNLKDPDLLIRTGGEERLSNFMLYQLAYTEFYFTSVLWPDFDEEEFDKAILSYIERDRRFGGLNEE